MSDDTPDPERREAEEKDLNLIALQFPDAMAEGTVLNTLVAAKVPTLPPETFENPRWRSQLTKQVAAELRASAIGLN